ncbi:MAG TPA: lysine 5,6-aminomutase subunit alpha [Candidatus Limnocylindrales bacterium]
MPTSLGDLDRLSDLATTIAGAWGARARSSTSTGQERAILRLFGVRGLDRAGHPLAAEVVERYAGQHPERLAGGIALPFAMALLEYDLAPQQLALDVASGAVDLAFEAELLGQPDRRAVAEVEARRLTAAAYERIDANRTARHELLDLLGEPAGPWVGTTLSRPTAAPALEEAIGLVRDGFDLLRVEVPVGWELATRLLDAGMSGVASDQDPADRLGDEAWEPAPTGSQRALAALRHALDEAAAERRSYVRLATAAPALAAPEQAVVAAFERVDVVEADPLSEIVAGRVDPDRALADHAFAHRLIQRGGATLLVGAGPLVVAPDLARGLPSDPATRAGRALALQLLGVAIARADGLPADRIVVSALPTWLTDEPDPIPSAVAEVSVRRELLPGHLLAFAETAGAERAHPPAWPYLITAALSRGTTSDGAPGPLLLRTTPTGDGPRRLHEARSAAMVAAELARSVRGGQLEGAALAHAKGAVSAAIATLERLADGGWPSVLGETPSGARRDRPRLGADAVTERTESFDPLADPTAPVQGRR